MYEVDKYYEKLITGKYTNFLDYNLQELLKRKLGKIKYNKYIPYIDSEKIIYYTDKLPNVLLYEIITKNTLKHQDILGTLFNLGIDKSMYGDILIINNHYYIYILDIIKNYLLSNLNKINNNKIELKKIDINYLKDYKRSYEEINIIVSSERIDTIISNLINCNRLKVIDKIKDKEILINYQIPKNSYKLNIGDIISIRKHGKYKYNGIIKNTKKNNYIISISKYI